MSTSFDATPVATGLSKEYLLALPKAEIHCHLGGCVPTEMAARLAKSHGVAIPESAVRDGGRYRFANFDEGLQVLHAITDSMQTARDFEEITYESLKVAASGGVRYREHYFDPQDHPHLSYSEMLKGITAGAQAAEEEVGVVSRIVPAINRERGGEAALELVREIVSHPHEWVVGIGLDSDEKAGRPSEFIAAYDLAREAGLKLSAHAGEHGNPDEVLEALDLLKVDRLDHGYAALEDEELRNRIAKSQLPVSACWFVDYPAWEVPGRIRDYIAMQEAGWNISVNSDDPALIGPELHDCFIDAALHMKWTVEDAERYSLAGVKGSFADDATKARLEAEFKAEFERIRSLA
ncbi:adenosine deaminase [Microbacterium phyllosphaerae]|uniref:adenosine deaminase n=1 Tax=Microbacterium phyllosphaerae TaxID=124798 RepID=UPI003D65614F